MRRGCYAKNLKRYQLEAILAQSPYNGLDVLLPSELEPIILDTCRCAECQAIFFDCSSKQCCQEQFMRIHGDLSITDTKFGNLATNIDFVEKYVALQYFAKHVLSDRFISGHKELKNGLGQVEPKFSFFSFDISEVVLKSKNDIEKKDGTIESLQKKAESLEKKLNECHMMILNMRTLLGKRLLLKRVAQKSSDNCSSPCIISSGDEWSFDTNNCD